MKNTFFAIVFSIFMLTACGGDDDGGLPPAKNYSIEYKVTASGGTTVNKIQYRDKDAEWVIIENPTVPWEISLTIPAGKALEAAAYGDIPFEEDLKIEARWSPAIDGQSNEAVNLKNETQNTTIENGKVEIEGRSLPRY